MCITIVVNTYVTDYTLLGQVSVHLTECIQSNLRYYVLNV
jgi:hypothetical protein